MAIRTREQGILALSNSTSKVVFTVPKGCAKIQIRNRDTSITVHYAFNEAATTDSFEIKAGETLTLDPPMAEEETFQMIAASGTPSINYIVQA